MLFKTAVVFSALACTLARPAVVTPNFWFSFGDSYTASGFSVNGTKPAVGNPMGNPPYPGKTTVGGVNWIDVDTVKYNKSLILTYNYAYGGATIDAKLVRPYTPTVHSLTDQVNEFLDGAAKKPTGAAWNSTNALFSIWIGINDIGGSYFLSGDRSAFSDTLLNAYFALVQKLVSVFFDSDSGARHFLFINVPPVDRSPSVRKSASAANIAKEKDVIDTFNTELQAKIAAFNSTHSGVTTYLWDSHAVFMAILNDPTAYGFKDATSYGSASNEFWGNDYHPSRYAHMIFGKDISVLLNATVW